MASDINSYSLPAHTKTLIDHPSPGSHYIRRGRQGDILNLIFSSDVIVNLPAAGRLIKG